MKESTFKWKAILGLIFVWTAIFTNLNWIWGVIFLIWVYPEIKYRRAFFIEPVKRDSHPILYWIIIASWILMSIYITLTAISSKLDPESEQFFGYQRTQIHAQLKDSTVITTGNSKIQPSVVGVANDKNPAIENDTLYYDTISIGEKYFAGISLQLNYKEDGFNNEIDKIWRRFNRLDLSKMPSDFHQDKTFAIYSNIDKDKMDWLCFNIAYQTNKLETLPPKFKTFAIPAGKYAVFISPGKKTEDLNMLWEKVLNSDLKRTKKFDFEIYYLDKEFDTEKAELWISIQK
jgi:predicted transcriptional regulator YdeE